MLVNPAKHRTLIDGSGAHGKVISRSNWHGKYPSVFLGWLTP
jgi:hypothetical protein